VDIVEPPNKPKEIKLPDDVELAALENEDRKKQNWLSRN
jgi:hypothetical protein